MNIRTLLRHGGEVSGAITCVLDITDSARVRQELEKRATFDALTGCYNRSSILSAVQGELEPRCLAGGRRLFGSRQIQAGQRHAGPRRGR